MKILATVASDQESRCSELACMEPQTLDTTRRWNTPGYQTESASLIHASILEQCQKAVIGAGNLRMGWLDYLWRLGTLVRNGDTEACGLEYGPRVCHTRLLQEVIVDRHGYFRSTSSWCSVHSSGPILSVGSPPRYL